jgi:molybdopterin-synthase adenylyltransferase
MSEHIERYHRQILLPQIGAAGMEKIAAASVTLIGCGALGAAMAEMLVRAGIGALRIVDRDFVEMSNLQRQLLFDESDATQSIPKAVAARAKLCAINSSVTIDADVVDVTPRNIESLITGADLVLDGTDNAETRYLINDACVKLDIPWVYGGAVGVEGLVAPISPRRGPCLRCFLPDPPPVGTFSTSDTTGVLSAAPLTVAALQVTAGMKLLLGSKAGLGTLTRVDVWHHRMTTIEIERDEACPACGHGRYAFLSAEHTQWTTKLYGRNAVQISPPDNPHLDLAALASGIISKSLETRYNGDLLTILADPFEIVLFPDGRGIIKGTDDETVA